MSTPATADKRRYDVYLTAGGRRFYFRNDNHGVTLDDARIAWTYDGRTEKAPLSDIVAVHLQSGGSWQNVIDQCEIAFATGDTVTVSNAGASGVPDDGQTPIYRDFVRDLHRRLAARGAGAIRFTAGYRPLNYRVVLVGAVLLGMICVALPLVLLAITGEFKVLGLLVGGVVLCWPLARMVQNNAPREYQPQKLPDELLS
jgi:hypothetical protein